MNVTEALKIIAAWGQTWNQKTLSHFEGFLTHDQASERANNEHGARSTTCAALGVEPLMM